MSLEASHILGREGKLRGELQDVDVEKIRAERELGIAESRIPAMEHEQSTLSALLDDERENTMVEYRKNQTLVRDMTVGQDKVIQHLKESGDRWREETGRVY